MKNSICFLLIVLIFSSNLLASETRRDQEMKKFRPSEKSYKWADKQFKKMTLDEKIGQLIHIGINAQYLAQDSLEYKELMRQVRELKVGGVIVFVGGLYETVHLVNRMQENSKIPLLISADFETGVGMRFFDAVNFPWAMAISATGNADFAYKQGVIVGRESRAMGIHQVFAPVVDVNNNADNPVINVRSFGENPADVAKFGSAFSQGLQSQNVLATAKHFPGHGDTAVDSHRGLPVINFSRERLEKTEFVPFRELIKSGVGSVMISHISMPQLDAEEVKPLKVSTKASYTESEIITENTTIPATLSTKIVTDILRKDMNFDGLIVTDAMDMSGLTLYFNPAEAAVRAILAGNDVLLKTTFPDEMIRGLKEAVKSGRLTEEKINDAVRRQLAWKHQLGLIDKKITPIEGIDSVVSNSEMRSLTNEIAANAITLVKTETNVFPLAKNKKLFFLGITNGDDKNFISNTFQRTLRANGYNFEVVVLDERATTAEINNAKNKAAEADIVLSGLFGRVRSGAANSVGIPEKAAEVLRGILKTDKTVVNIAFGNPYLLKNFPDMKTYIVAYGDMRSLQGATADALSGKIGFKGKLPITVGNYPIGTGLK
ncbi:MAG TPA: glycoside hydrolase family 3 N-terminal domain-containing protein [Pyrinomonadaceae bacterium]|nr:glycoside hydrolase family 3 N-terminal domain-containing protein [Pyrinomonadaceae bacterium]